MQMMALLGRSARIDFDPGNVEEKVFGMPEVSWIASGPILINSSINELTARLQMKKFQS